MRRYIKRESGLSLTEMAQLPFFSTWQDLLDTPPEQVGPVVLVGGLVNPGIYKKTEDGWYQNILKPYSVKEYTEAEAPGFPFPYNKRASPILTKSGVRVLYVIDEDAGEGEVSSNEYNVGDIIWYDKPTSPSEKWLPLFNGASTFDSSLYPELYNLLGSNKLPDIRGCFIRGSGDDGSGTYTANVKGTVYAANLNPSHKHTGSYSSGHSHTSTFSHTHNWLGDSGWYTTGTSYLGTKTIEYKATNRPTSTNGTYTNSVSITQKAAFSGTSAAPVVKQLDNDGVEHTVSGVGSQMNCVRLYAYIRAAV